MRDGPLWLDFCGQVCCRSPAAERRSLHAADTCPAMKLRFCDNRSRSGEVSPSRFSGGARVSGELGELTQVLCDGGEGSLNCAPLGPRRRNRTRPKMRLRWANSISDLCDRDVIRIGPGSGEVRGQHRAPSHCQRHDRVRRAGAFGQQLSFSGQARHPERKPGSGTCGQRKKAGPVVVSALFAGQNTRMLRSLSKMNSSP